MEEKYCEKTPFPQSFRLQNLLKKRGPPKQRLGEGTSSEIADKRKEKARHTCEILAETSDCETRSLTSENKEKDSFSNEGALLQERIEVLEAELRNTQEEVRQLLVDSEAKRFCVENIAKDDKLFTFFIQDFHTVNFRYVLNILVNRCLVSDTKGQVTIDSKDKSLGREDLLEKLSPENEFLLVLTRLKVGLLEQDLAVRFQLDQSTVSRIITTWISFMYCMPDLRSSIYGHLINSVTRICLDMSETFIQNLDVSYCRCN